MRRGVLSRNWGSDYVLDRHTHTCPRTLHLAAVVYGCTWPSRLRLAKTPPPLTCPHRQQTLAVAFGWRPFLSAGAVLILLFSSIAVCNAALGVVSWVLYFDPGRRVAHNAKRGSDMRGLAFCLAALLVSALAAGAAQAVTIDLVPVGVLRSEQVGRGGLLAVPRKERYRSGSQHQHECAIRRRFVQGCRQPLRHL